ncbi:MAG: heavy-metal-associated domain-containing protein [Burkholderiales bacterium]|nr:heavy-metal-associated domain-containing protein [Burkholderiales bacterium]
MMTQQTYIVSGMTCQHCVQNVHNRLSAVTGVQNVRVQLMPPRAVVEGDVALSALAQALSDSQFKIEAMNA